MKIVIWKIPNGIRVHITDQALKKRLHRIKNIGIANTYFFKSKIIGWDIDFPIAKTKLLEKILGVTCDYSDC